MLTNFLKSMGLGPRDSVAGVLKYDKNKLLGEGGYGQVYLGEFNGTKVAVKRVQVTRDQSYLTEENALKKLNHPNVIKLLYCESDPDFRYYAMELCACSIKQLFLPDGSPEKYKGPPLPPPEDVLIQMFRGLNYIHTVARLVHRDIKPENVLISFPDQSSAMPVIKWADFGLSKPLQGSRMSYTPSGFNRGTYYWMAPESYKASRDQDPNYKGTILSDNFSAACVAFYFLTKGSHPFGPLVDEVIPNNVMANKPIFFNKLEFDHFARDVIVEMLAYLPKDRMQLEKAIHYLENKEWLKLSRKISHDGNQLLGFGPYKTWVFKGTLKMPGSQIEKLVAVKKMDRTKQKTKEKEFSVLHHSNVVELFYAESDSELNFRYFALELCAGSIDQLFLPDDEPRKYRGNIPGPKEVIPLAKGLAYIHSKDLIHGAIKPENVLISFATKTEGVTLKWADFGLRKSAKDLDALDALFKLSLRPWVRSENRSIEGDLWSAACVFFYFLTGGSHPFIEPDFDTPTNLSKLPFNHFALRAIRMMLTDKSSLNECIKLMEKNLENSKMERENTILVYCAKENPTESEVGELVRLVQDDGIDLNFTDLNGLSPLLQLCKKNRSNTTLFRCLQSLLAEEKEGFDIIPVDVNVEDKDGLNCLLHLCGQPSVQQLDVDILEKVLKLLFEMGVDGKAVTRHVRANALHLLCENYKKIGLARLIQILLDDGHIDVRSRDARDYDALLIVCESYPHEDLTEIVRLLVERGAELYLEGDDHKDLNALDRLCNRRFQRDESIDLVSLFEFLIVEKRMDLKIPSRVSFSEVDGLTMLHLTCHQRWDDPKLYDLVKILIDNGADVEAKNSAGDIALDYLTTKGFKKPDGFNPEKVIQLLTAQ